MSDGHTERRRRALAIFDEVAELSGQARRLKLDELCGNDQELQAQVPHPVDGPMPHDAVGREDRRELGPGDPGRGREADLARAVRLG